MGRVVLRFTCRGRGEREGCAAAASVGHQSSGQAAELHCSEPVPGAGRGLFRHRRARAAEEMCFVSETSASWTVTQRRLLLSLLRLCGDSAGCLQIAAGAPGSSVKRPALDFSSSRALKAMRSSPTSDSPLSRGLLLPLSLLCPFSHSLTLQSKSSKKNLKRERLESFNFFCVQPRKICRL